MPTRAQIAIQSKSDHNSSTLIFRLPPELRNSIYAELFGFDSCPYFNPVLSYRKIQHCACQPDFSMMRVCRQSRDETINLFYESHDFRFVLDKANKRIIEGWIDSIDPQALTHIRRFHIERYKTPDFEHRHPFEYHPRKWYHHKGQINIALNETNVSVWISCNECNDNVELDKQALRNVPRVMCEDFPMLDLKPVLTKAKLLEILNAAGWSLKSGNDGW